MAITAPFSRLTSLLSRSLVFPPEFGGRSGVGGDPRAGRQMFYSVGKRSEGGSVIMIAIGHARTPHPPSNATPPRTASIGPRNRSGRRSLFPSRSRGPRVSKTPSGRAEGVDQEAGKHTNIPSTHLSHSVNDKNCRDSLKTGGAGC